MRKVGCGWPAWACWPWPPSLPGRATRPPKARRPCRPNNSPTGSTQLIEAKLAEQEISRSPLADDAEFLRRLSLDVGGRIPGVMDLRLFFAEKSSDKRRKAVDKLLDSPLYSTHFAAVWRSLMVPDSNNQFLQGTRAAARSLAEEPPARKHALRQDGPRDHHRAGHRRPGHDEHARRHRRADAAAVLPGPGNEAGEPGGGDGAAVPRGQDRVRPVPQPPVCQVEEGAVLGVRRLLLRHPDAAGPGRLHGHRRCRRPPRDQDHRHRQGRAGPLPRQKRAEMEQKASTRQTLADWVTRRTTLTLPERPPTASGPTSSAWASSIRSPRRATRTRPAIRNCSTSWPGNSPCTIST